jgi:heptaprenyl diphosphate synthase
MPRASAQALFVCGALLFPPFLLQQDLVIRAFVIVLFMVLNALAGKRVRLLQFVAVAAGIVLFNLVIPTGRVLVMTLGLPVTEGALKSGLMKATAMTGLIVLSQFSIRPDLRLPGRIGGLVGRSLFYFEAIMNERRKIDRKDIIGSIDALLVSVSASSAPSASAVPAASAESAALNRGRSSEIPAGWSRGLPALLVLVAANWAVFLLTVVHPRPFWGG